jgi:hypothetical protein
MMSFYIPEYEGDEISAVLKPYQRELIDKLLVQYDEEASAKIWLSSAGPLDLRQFGGAQEDNGNEFFKRFRSEFHAYVCGHERYKDEREEFMKIAKPAASYVVTVISVAVAGVLGVAVGFIVPAVALLLKLVCRLGVNAWCEVEKP